MIPCVLCGQRPAELGLDMLCKQCDRERQVSLARSLVFGDIQEHMSAALHAMTEFEKRFPDGTMLIEEAHRAVAAVLPGIDTLHRQMRRQADEAEKRLQAAQEEGQRLLFEEREGE